MNLSRYGRYLTRLPQLAEKYLENDTISPLAMVAAAVVVVGVVVSAFTDDSVSE